MRFSKYALNRKSETHVPLNTLFGIRHGMSLQIGEGPKYKSKKDIRIFAPRSYRVKNVSRSSNVL